MRRSSSRQTEGIHDPNMTPLIDVSLVLVVILLVATPLALQSGIAISRGAAGGRAAPSTPAQRVEITIHSRDDIEVNKWHVTRAALAPTLRPLLAASATREVVVRCDDPVPHGDFVDVLDEAKAQGAYKIAVVGR